MGDRQRVWVTGNRLVRSVDQSDGGVRLGVEEVHTGVVEHVDAGAVVLATGFRDLGPATNQEPYPAVMSGIADRFVFEDGYPRVSEDYLVETRGAPPLFLNGGCETSHGIGDAGSFSLLSLRTAAIQRRLADIIGGARGGGPVTINATTERHDFASTAPDARPPVADLA